MALGWDELTALVGGKTCHIERIRIVDSDICIDGEFELPPLAQLPYDDQVFVAMFIRAHGSIKETEKAFGISYPTVKARLNRIADRLGFVDIVNIVPQDEILDQLERGEITVKDAVERIKQR